MNIENLTTIEELEHFIQGNQAVAFTVLGDKNQRYQFIQKTLIKFRYITLKKTDKGIVNQYLKKVTGYSLQQLTRLIKQYKDVGRINWQPCRTNGFSTIYSTKDIKLLAEMDARHDDICGHATKKLLERAYNTFEQSEYQMLATISVSHLYNLRHSQGYQKQRRHFTKTQSRQVPIGERRKPQPNSVGWSTPQVGRADNRAKSAARRCSVGGRLVLHLTKRTRAARHGTRKLCLRSFEAASVEPARRQWSKASVNGVGRSALRVGREDNRAKSAVRACSVVGRLVLHVTKRARAARHGVGTFLL